MNKILSTLLTFIFLSVTSSFALLRDDFVEDTLKNQTLSMPYQNLNYDYNSLNRIPIKLQIIKNISTTKRNKNFESEKIEFKVKQNVKYNKELILPQGTIVTGELQTMLSNGMNGIPAEIILDNFELPNIDQQKTKSTYIKKGVSMSLLVFPLKWALTPFVGVGSLTNLIFGRNAYVTDKDTIVIYYYPDWHTANQPNIMEK